MKLRMKHLALAAVFGGAALMMPQAEANETIHVPEHIYQWVQSSSRMNYFFNKAEICYGVDADGHIDLNILKVPVVKTYDPVQIQDVLQKRRWRHESVDGYGGLAGEANYLTFDLEKKTVTVDRCDLIDFSMWTLTSSHPEGVIELSKMAVKNRDAIFFRAILDYEAKHRSEIVNHTKGELRDADAKRLKKERKALEKAEKERLRKEHK